MQPRRLLGSPRTNDNLNGSPATALINCPKAVRAKGNLQPQSTMMALFTKMRREETAIHASVAANASPEARASPAAAALCFRDDAARTPPTERSGSSSVKSNTRSTDSHSSSSLGAPPGLKVSDVPWKQCIVFSALRMRTLLLAVWAGRGVPASSPGAGRAGLRADLIGFAPLS